MTDADEPTSDASTAEISTARTALTRLQDKGSDDRDALYRLLDEIHIGHFAILASHGPVVLPTMVARDGDWILTHGSTGSVWMRLLASGAATSLAVSAYDGIVVARSAFESSMLYRSCVLFGSCEVVDAPEDKLHALDVMTDAVLPGRSSEIRRPLTKELAATLVLRMPIQQWSLKISQKWPDDPEDDIAGDAWAGVIGARTSYDQPRPAPNLRDDIALPSSVQQVAMNSVTSSWDGSLLR